jgi:hypothetical protein
VTCPAALREKRSACSSRGRGRRWDAVDVAAWGAEGEGAQDLGDVSARP